MQKMSKFEQSPQTLTSLLFQTCLENLEDNYMSYTSNTEQIGSTILDLGYLPYGLVAFETVLKISQQSLLSVNSLLTGNYSNIGLAGHLQ